MKFAEPNPTVDVPAYITRLVLHAVREGNVRSAHALWRRAHGAPLRVLDEAFTRLRADGMIFAPADDGAGVWTISPQGAEYLRATPPTLLETILNAT